MSVKEVRKQIMAGHDSVLEFAQGQRATAEDIRQIGGFSVAADEAVGRLVRHVQAMDTRLGDITHEQTLHKEELNQTIGGISETVSGSPHYEGPLGKLQGVSTAAEESIGRTTSLQERMREAASRLGEVREYLGTLAADVAASQEAYETNAANATNAAHDIAGAVARM